MKPRAWPVFKPHNSDLIASPPSGWHSGNKKDELGYKPFFRKPRMDEIECNSALKIAFDR